MAPALTSREPDRTASASKPTVRHPLQFSAPARASDIVGPKCEGVKTGRIRRDEDLISLRQLVPTLAWRKPGRAGLSGF